MKPKFIGWQQQIFRNVTMEKDFLECLILWLQTVIANEGNETGREKY